MRPPLSNVGLKEALKIGDFGVGSKKDSLPDSLNGASGFFGSGGYSIEGNSGVVIQSSYGAERRGQYGVAGGNAYFRFCTTPSDDPSVHPWKKLLYDGITNPTFRGYVTQKNNSSMIREWHNEAVSQIAIGAKTQFHVNMAQGDGSAVSEFLLVRRNGTNTTGQIVVTFPKTGGTIALQGTSGIDFKKDINDAEPQDALDRINALRLVNYIYKDDKEERIRFGIIAEEAEKIAPQYIKHNKEYVDDVLDPITNEVIDKIYRDRPSVDVNPIVMDLLGAIQVLNSKIKEREKQMELLEKRVTQFTSR